MNELNRREFCVASSAALLSLTKNLESQHGDSDSGPPSEPFIWQSSTLILPFSVTANRIRQGALLPSRSDVKHAATGEGVVAAMQCTAEDSPDSGSKQAGGNPGLHLTFIDKQEETTATGRRLIVRQTDDERKLSVETVYESFDGVPVLRCHTKTENLGKSSIGIEYLSSIMLHGLGDGQRFDDQLRIHYASNSWMAEGQWHTVRPLEMGLVENERTSWNEADATSIGTWSTEKYLAMAAVENSQEGLIWFWQIEHNGSWHWQISNSSSRGQRADNVYAYLGGPDALHAQAWKNLLPGQTYETVPVAIGCVAGGFTEAAQALTLYRRKYCMMPRRTTEPCPIIFNDYMNCLSGDPTEEKELPLIDAAAEIGCEYYVIDAGWYAERNENWGVTVGAWQPSKTRWPHGLKYTLDYIRRKGMVPGLWLEPEVAGRNSPLAAKPDNWFLIRHGKRFIHNDRMQLDLRNEEVRGYLDEVVDRCVTEYGAGYLKFDYNTTSLEGTELNSDSLGQGLLEHNRAHLLWLEGLLKRHKDLVIENCGSGGGRMDYAMLSRLQLQSVSDQEDYRRLPAIATGSSAAVLPEQMAVWSYPLQDASADAASFNMVNALLGRIHQSGHLANLAPAALRQVKTALILYKKTIRPVIPTAIPFYPLGLPQITDHKTPISLGMKTDRMKFIAVWRLEGSETVVLPGVHGHAELLYPVDLGIGLTQGADGNVLRFPRPYMAALIRMPVA